MGTLKTEFAVHLWRQGLTRKIRNPHHMASKWDQGIEKLIQEYNTSRRRQADEISMLRVHTGRQNQSGNGKAVDGAIEGKIRRECFEMEVSYIKHSWKVKVDEGHKSGEERRDSGSPQTPRFPWVWEQPIFRHFLLSHSIKASMSMGKQFLQHSFNELQVPEWKIGSF